MTVCHGLIQWCDGTKPEDMVTDFRKTSQTSVEKDKKWKLLRARSTLVNILKRNTALM